MRTIVLLFYCFVSVDLSAQSAQSSDSTHPTSRKANQATHGTVNIIAANDNGIAVITDSMLTDGNGKHRERPAQKLFQLDEWTVCTVADFYSQTGPIPDLDADAASIVIAYQESLRREHVRLPVVEKLRQVDYLISLYMKTVYLARETTGLGIAPTGSQLLIAGYDADGSAHIGKIVLVPKREADGVIDLVVSEVETKTVSKTLIYETAGRDDIAQEVLRHPAIRIVPPILGAYAKSYARDGGASFSLTEMKDLVSELKRETSENRAGVGGPDQIALLAQGKILGIDTSFKDDKHAPALRFSLGYNMSCSNGACVISEEPQIFINVYFTNTPISLDSNYFFKTHFSYATLRYDGGIYNLDERYNTVANSTLMLGPHVNKESPQVMELARRFTFLSVIEGPR